MGTIAIVFLFVTGKFGGRRLAARLLGFGWRGKHSWLADELQRVGRLNCPEWA